MRWASGGHERASAATRGRGGGAGGGHQAASPDGRFSDKTSAFDPENVLQPNVAKFLRHSDRDIVKRLHAMKYAVPVQAGAALVGEDGVSALEAMIGTGRAHWGAITGPVITQGPARQGRLVWRLADNGSQYPDFVLDESTGARVLRLAPPWYVETATAVMGPVETGFAARIAVGILSAPPVPARQGKLLRAAITRQLPALTMIEPPELEPPQRIEKPPVPGLRLLARDLPRLMSEEFVRRLRIYPHALRAANSYSW